MAAPLCDASGTGASVGSHDSSSSSVSMDDEVASKRIKQHQMEQHPLPSISTESSASSLSILTGKEASPRLLWICPASPSQTALAPNGFRLISLNIHRLLITALMVAAKFTSDLYYSNARYAKYGGLRLEELNQLELEFLFAIKFDLNVKVPHIEQVGRLLHAFEQAASPSSSAVVSSSPSPASTPAMMAVDRFSASSSVSPSAEKPTGTASSSAIHPQAPVHAQQHQQYPHSSLPYSASAPTPDASNQPDRGPCQGQGMCQGQSPKSATTHASAVHMQSSSKVVGHLLSPPEEKQHGWDE
ncbi:hypothetical protein BGZ73_008248 [Actinomortierella ambigua]|nr:hypothetical protein BGZ73_008248 [Actinomortierella ambigua]